MALGFPCGGHADSRGALQEIRGAERGHEPVQLSVPLDAPEALRGAQQTEPDPPPPHVTIAPALDVPRDVPHRADQILEALVNAIHRAAPGAAIAFNTRPEDTGAAAARWI